MHTLIKLSVAIDIIQLDNLVSKREVRQLLTKTLIL